MPTPITPVPTFSTPLTVAGTDSPNSAGMLEVLQTHANRAEFLYQQPSWLSGLTHLGGEYTGTIGEAVLARPVISSTGRVWAGCSQMSGGLPAAIFADAASGPNDWAGFAPTGIHVDFEQAVAGAADGEVLVADCVIDPTAPTVWLLRSGSWWPITYTGTINVTSEMAFPQALAYDANISGGAYVIASTEGFRYVTDPVGVGWSPVAVASFHTYVVHPVTGTRLATGYPTNDVYRCGGGSVATLPANWTSVLTPNASGSRIRRIVPFGAQSWLYIYSTAGAYLSTNDGVTWTELTYSDSTPPAGANVLPGDAVWAGDRLIGVGFQNAVVENRQHFLYQSRDGISWTKWPMGVAASWHSPLAYFPAQRRVGFSYLRPATEGATKLDFWLSGVVGAGASIVPAS